MGGARRGEAGALVEVPGAGVGLDDPEGSVWRSRVLAHSTITVQQAAGQL